MNLDNFIVNECLSLCLCAAVPLLVALTTIELSRRQKPASNKNKRQVLQGKSSRFGPWVCSDLIKSTQKDVLNDVKDENRKKITTAPSTIHLRIQDVQNTM